MNKTIEELTSDTILQNPVKIDIGSKKYNVAPPTAATMIEVSKYISFLPEIKTLENNDDVLYYVLNNANACESIGDIVAILILGKKHLKTVKRKYLFWKIEIDNQKELAKYLLENLSIEEIHSLMGKLFELQNVAFFLGIINFLREIAIVKKK